MLTTKLRWLTNKPNTAASHVCEQTMKEAASISQNLEMKENPEKHLYQVCKNWPLYQMSKIKFLMSQRMLLRKVTMECITWLKFF